MNKKANDSETLTIREALCKSAITAFETMVFKSVEIKPPFLRQGTLPPGSISGTISLAGENITGSVSLIFSLDVAEKFFRSMMMMDEKDPVNANELKDVVGELTNMVAGGAKSQLQAKEIHFSIGLPTVVVGDNHYLEPPQEATCFVIPAQTDAGGFTMIFSII